MAVARMVQALRPGGWLMLEEFDVPPLTSDTAWDRGLTILRTSEAFRSAMERSGVDMHCGRRLPGMTRAHGLVSIGGRAGCRSGPRGSAGARLMRSNYVGLQQRMIDEGSIHEVEFDADLARSARPIS